MNKITPVSAATLTPRGAFWTVGVTTQSRQLAQRSPPPTRQAPAQQQVVPQSPQRRSP